MARAQSDAGRLVGAVDQVARPLQVEGVLAERVVGSRADHRLEVLAVLVMLLAHRHRHAPGGVLLAPHDLGDALGSTPADLADADGVGEHHRALAGLHRRVIEDAHRRDVDDDARVRGLRQDELRRHDDLATLARQPGIDLGVGAQDLLVADVEAPRDVGERVVLARPWLTCTTPTMSCPGASSKRSLATGSGSGGGAGGGGGGGGGAGCLKAPNSEQAASSTQERRRERSAGGSKLHGQTIMTDVAQRRMSSMRYSSTGWLRQLVAARGRCLENAGRAARPPPGCRRSSPPESVLRGSGAASAGTPSAHSASVTRAAMPRSAMISTA